MTRPSKNAQSDAVIELLRAEATQKLSNGLEARLTEMASAQPIPTRRHRSRRWIAPVGIAAAVATVTAVFVLAVKPIGEPTSSTRASLGGSALMSAVSTALSTDASSAQPILFPRCGTGWQIEDAARPFTVQVDWPPEFPNGNRIWVTMTVRNETSIPQTGTVMGQVVVQNATGLVVGISQDVQLYARPVTTIAPGESHRQQIKVPPLRSCYSGAALEPGSYIVTMLFSLVDQPVGVTPGQVVTVVAG